MTHKASHTQSPERLEPLLQSIQKEITERTQRLGDLEQRLGAFRSTPHAHADEISRLRSEISTHRRELRRIQGELERLGVAFDADNPQPILAQAHILRTGSRSLEDTGFRPRYADSRT